MIFLLFLIFCFVLSICLKLPSLALIFWLFLGIYHAVIYLTIDHPERAYRQSEDTQILRMCTACLLVFSGLLGGYITNPLTHNQYK